MAEKVTSVLSILIKNDQTGFIPCRYKGVNNRLTYDLLHYTEENDIPCILLPIHLEKAFVSISRIIIEQVLYFSI